MAVLSWPYGLLKTTLKELTMNDYKTKRTPIHTYDLDRKPIVLVPLGGNIANGQHAKLLKKDYEELLSRGYSPNWCLLDDGSGRNQYVTLYDRMKGNQVKVPRLIMSASSDQVIRYMDGNRLNLRRDNLHLQDRERHVTQIMEKKANAR
ncbi:hypothetical protein [Paremcibacter congregatus]|uniref:hypothetical protein n=1 Tax=Paremcibacter congregatus TaxID=2043170 RepID=UPI003A91CD1D